MADQPLGPPARRVQTSSPPSPTPSRTTGVDPGRLHLEVTESALIDDLATSIERLDQLKTLGVHIDIDDFGTGYSSLAYLKRLPIDTLKIDQSFTDGLGTDPHDTSIVHAIISLGPRPRPGPHGRGRRDRDAAGRAATTSAATWRQGFHWSRPLPPTICSPGSGTTIADDRPSRCGSRLVVPIPR